MDEEEQKLIAEFKRQVGPDGDWQEAYRQWYRRKGEEKVEQWLRSTRRHERELAIEEAKLRRARETRQQRRRLLGSIAASTMRRGR